MASKSSVVLVCVLLSACGGAAPRGDTIPEPSGRRERTDPVEDGAGGMAVEGLMGTISPRAVNAALEPRIGRFARCFQDRYRDIEILGGDIEFAFRVKTDGTVRTVHATSSTVGDRETERCLLRVAAGTRFERPQGGEAEFSWPLALDPPEEIRPPFGWDPTRVASVVRARGPELSSCIGMGGARVQVTAYVSPGGRVLTAGAASGSAGASGALDCVAETVRGWPMPDPGSYPAKVTFEVP